MFSVIMNRLVERTNAVLGNNMSTRCVTVTVVDIQLALNLTEYIRSFPSNTKMKKNYENEINFDLTLRLFD